MKGSALWQKWSAFAHAHPDAIVWTEALTGQNYTAAAVSRQAEALYAGPLAEACGRAVAFQLPNSVDWIVLFLALQRLGCAAVPLDSGLRETNTHTAAARLGASFLWEKEHLFPLVPERSPRRGVCCIKSTSGSTGQPRAVDCLPSHLLADGANIVATMDVRPEDRNLALIPLGHSYGLGNLVMPLILQGTAVVAAPDFIPRQIPDWIHRYAVTVFPSVPVIFQLLCSLPDPVPLSPLRVAISAGSPLKPSVARAFFHKFGLPLHNFYGSSETGGIAYDTTGTAVSERGSVGTPLQGVDVSLREGRITVSGPAVAMRGHRHVMPDHGTWNDAGELCLEGRAWAVANIGGNKVNPAEIERVLHSLPDVQEAWVGVFATEQRDYLGAAAQTSMTSEQLRQHLAQHLPDWKIPKALMVCESLPRTARGKIDAAAVRTLFLDAHD
jgi:acyl-CoA synthetase (AMP-forming)/AMP-acid ligase II